MNCKNLINETTYVDGLNVVELFSSAHVLIGGRDLILRIENADGEVKEGRFRVTKMRCWRIMTLTQSQVKSPEFVSSVFYHYD